MRERERKLYIMIIHICCWCCCFEFILYRFYKYLGRKVGFGSLISLRSLLLIAAASAIVVDSIERNIPFVISNFMDSSLIDQITMEQILFSFSDVHLQSDIVFGGLNFQKKIYLMSFDLIFFLLLLQEIILNYAKD